MAGTTRISALTAIAAAAITATSVLPITTDKTSPTLVTNKISLAQIRTAIFGGGAGYTATDPLNVGAVTATTVTASGAIQVTGGTAVAGSMTKSGSAGLLLQGVTGSGYDFAVNNAGATATILGNPTGTNNVTIPNGTLTVASGLTVSAGGITVSAGDVVLANAASLRAVYSGTAYALATLDANAVLQLGQTTVIPVAIPKNTGVGASSTLKGVLYVDTATAGQIVFFDGVTGARYKLTGTAF